ncbi:cache domain-containing protein [Peptostreptococcaceae bacterium AGR-M142]
MFIKKFVFLIILLIPLTLFNACTFQVNAGAMQNQNEENSKLTQIENLESNLKEDVDKFNKLADELIKLQNDDNIDSKLQELRDKNKDRYDYVFYYKESNDTIYINPKTTLPQDYNPKERIWYKKALENKDNENSIYYSTPYKDFITENEIVSISKILKDENGNNIGALLFDIIYKIKDDIVE